tara:strand:- start:56 stop:658 length:603 start_codon:yes stop_codon:yes gene_type:complete
MKSKENLRIKFKLARNEIANNLGKDCISIENFLKLILILKKNNFELRNIGAYYPINSEISPLKLIDICTQHNINLCLPSICSKSLKLNFRKWDGIENLVLSSFKTFEPSLKNQIMQPDIIFVPLLAYDIELNRLGYGGGFYDKTIYNLRNVNEQKNPFLAIGIGYDSQFIRSLPTEKHDQKMDIVITEKKLIFKKGLFNK